MAKDMYRHATQARFGADSPQHLGQADEVAIAALGGEHPRAALTDRHPIEELDGLAADRAELGAALGVPESQAPAAPVYPGPWKRQRLHPPQTRQQQEPDRGYGSPVARSLVAAKSGSQDPYLVQIQESPLPAFGQPRDLAGRVLADHLPAPGDFQDGREHPDRACRNHGAAISNATATAEPARLGGLAGRDVGLHPFDILCGQARQGLPAEKRLDVRLDSAAI